MAAKKSEYKTYSCYTDKQVNAMKKKLAAAIIEVTKVIDQKNPMAQPYASLLKKYRKMLQDANNYLGWSVALKAQDKPSMRIKKR